MKNPRLCRVLADALPDLPFRPVAGFRVERDRRDVGWVGSPAYEHQAARVQYLALARPRSAEHDYRAFGGRCRVPLHVLEWGDDPCLGVVRVWRRRRPP